MIGVGRGLYFVFWVWIYDLRALFYGMES